LEQKINNSRINLKAKSNSEDNTMKTTKKLKTTPAVECEGNAHTPAQFGFWRFWRSLMVGKVEPEI
jgi:hypothetical protein